MWACHHLDIFLGIVGHIQEFCTTRMGQVPSILSLRSDEKKMKSNMLGIDLIGIVGSRITYGYSYDQALHDLKGRGRMQQPEV